jgi:hypothetical protein
MRIRHSLIDKRPEKSLIPGLLRLSHRTIYETQVIALHIYCFWAGRSIVIDEPQTAYNFERVEF